MREKPSITRIKLFFTGVFILAGVGIGLGAFTFYYGKGYAYLTNDPMACAQCHVMQDQFRGWMKSSHQGVAHCNDCHSPQADSLTGFLAKYAAKGINGFNHSFAFSTGRYVEPLKINAMNRRIAENNCVRCHASLWESPRTGYFTHTGGIGSLTEGTRCTECHNQVGHPH